MRKSLHILIIPLYLFLSACSQTEPENPLCFVQCASIPVARTSATAFVLNGEAYVFGGRANGSYLNDFWKYSPASDTWTQLPDVPFHARVKATAQVVDGKAYCGIGFNGKIYTDSCYLRDWWCYDAASATWQQLTDYPENNTDAAVSFSMGNMVYVCYGFYNGFKRSVFSYDTATDEWASMPDADTYMLAGGVGCSDGIRCFAGTGYRTEMINKWYEFFPETGKWQSCRKMPDKGRVFASALAVNSRFFVMGGRYFGGTETREIFYDDLMEYDAAADQWLLRGYLPQGGRENMVAFSIAGKGYFGLGNNKENEIFGDLYSFE